ncbi:Tn7 transposase TnsA N-terminal domain-containing protein [Sphingomonas sp. S1-29]|uniref:hypothetical protein n=1 Tax=Sphingomonas sp. S1-29 TaxID=2991074 RepID=UPI00224002E5|nr:hypothetical protein [Sphingomonas sp. S1-29]UZK68775.1 Tn7 transposase TnsA N-terminal domain-containing protein [Sphingomonas sp. S1-29]
MRIKHEDKQVVKRAKPAIRIEPRHADRRIPNYYNATEPASRGRLRRPAHRWPGMEEASRLAKIVVLEHGGHANPVIKRGQKHLRSRMGSRKTGRQQVVEGRGHRDLTMWNEVNPKCLDYEAHPFHIQGRIEDSLFDYFPDHIRLMRDGTIELIEVKRTPADLDDPAYREKLGAVAEIARRAGWNFRILYHADIIGPRWRMQNVEGVYARRFMLVSRREQDVITSFVLRGEDATWADIRGRIAPHDHRRANAVIENAIALGRIDVDFDQRFTAATILTPLEPMSHNDQIRI